ncbi:hypothetical protein BC831DRAFT_72108 [Entophlyctis helioformis]|nr:hypothetical protein BC831DRAFT_72108 [Entophlyctis helioformis]
MGQHSLAGRVLQGRWRDALLKVACSRPCSRPCSRAAWSWPSERRAQQGGRTEGRLQTGNKGRWQDGREQGELVVVQEDSESIGIAGPSCLVLSDCDMGCSSSDEQPLRRAQWIDPWSWLQELLAGQLDWHADLDAKLGSGSTLDEQHTRRH